MKSKRDAIATNLVLVVAALIGLVVWFVFKQDESRLIKNGEGLVSAALVKSLGEGLTSRHPEMPTFVFSANEVEAIMSYLDSIQEP